MQKLFKKEFTMITDPGIETLYFGALPSEGRYFIKECEKLSPGNFRVSVEVSQGDLYYHFRIKDDWNKVLLDPNNLQIGAKNWHSICRIGTTSFNMLEFDLTNSYIAKTDDENVEIKIVAHQEWITGICFVSVNQERTEQYSMECVYDGKSRKYFRLKLPNVKLVSNDFVFLIKFENGDEQYYNANKQLSGEILDPFSVEFEKLKLFRDKNIGPVYQIFPDSFAKAGEVNDCGRKILKWNDMPDGVSFYGGNIRGIISKIGYLKELGIKCVYLTPVFWAHSNDRYDCIDYRRVDPMLGTEEDFFELCTLLHKNDIKIILDIVLNHCGTDFWMFRDVLEKQEESEFAEYYNINRFPVKYEEFFPNYSSWWGNGKMPQFNLENEKVVDYLFSCCRYWINKYDIDGWRIDVSSELRHDLLKMFRRAMLEVRDDLVIIGENWKDSRTFLSGDELDGVTNYLCWWKAFYPFFSNENVNVSKFAMGLYESYFCYSHNRSLSNWNIIGSHDVARFYSQMKNKKNIKSVIAIQMFIPGNPVVYYGDEFALDGADTPDNRRTLDWDNLDQNNVIYSNYKSILKIRNNSSALQRGDFLIPYQDDDKRILVLKRADENEEVYEIINFSDVDISFDPASLNIEGEMYDMRTDSIIDETAIIVEKNGFSIIRVSRMITD